MKLTVVIHTEDKDKLSKLFELIEKNPNKKYFSLYLHAKGYVPWEDDKLKNVIVSFKSYNAFPTVKSKIESVVEIVSIVKDEKILIFDEDCDSFNLNEWDDSKLNFLLSSKEDIIKLNLDTKYQTLKWFIVDLISQKNKIKVGISDDSEDSIRYFKKIESPIFYDKIIYVDGGMGDHIMALPLLEKIQNDIHICCKYPFVFEHLNFKGSIHWNDDLFGGYRRFVYEYGSLNNSKTIIDAFFKMYGYERNENDLLIYNGIREKNQIDTNGKPIALICSSAAKIENLDSNKDWRDIRWLKLVHELKKRNYYVVQVGTIKDNQIPTVDLKYLDKQLNGLASLIDESSLWISVDTFFHHFASSIKPNVGICLTPFYNDHAKHKGVTYIEKDCGKDFSGRRWWMDLQQPERKECMDLIQLEDVLQYITNSVKKNITWLAKYDDYSSMGILSQKILENLKDVNVACKEIIGETKTKNKLIHDLLNKPINHDIGIMFAYPDMVSELKEFKTKVIYTGVDTTKGYSRFTSKSKEVDYILTPSNLSKERMINMGVEKPIFVFPHGIDKNQFTYKPRIKGDKFKFLYVGECSDRKGVFHLLTAFLHLFEGNENVELHMKSNNAMLFYGGNEIKKIVDSNPNIIWEISNEGHKRTLELYDECHVYVYPSRADTFGMTVLEAMGCGLPVISTSEPGSTELVRDMYYQVRTETVPVINHPWMLGEWGEPNIDDLKKLMKSLYEKYDEIVIPEKLKEISEYVNENYNWGKISEKFENDILPFLNKEVKIITLATSYKRPHHIKNLIESIKGNRENGYINDIYLVDNTNDDSKSEVVKIINENVDERFKVYISEFNLGQRGVLLQMLEDVNLDDYDFIQFTDQDNLLVEPLSTYCNILNENPDIHITTGYMSKEHSELGWRKTRFGNLCEKRSLRGGHMFMRMSDFKSLFPIHLDSKYGDPCNSSWYAGLDWELTYWNSKSIGQKTDKNFVLCVPGGVLHKGIDSTFYDWPVEENEYTQEELRKMR